MIETEPMFEMEPLVIAVGDTVRVQTIFGVESGVVTAREHTHEGFPMVTVETENGDTITISSGRLLA